MTSKRVWKISARSISWLVGILIVLGGILFIPLRQSPQVASAVGSSDWTTYMGSIAHTGYNASETTLTASNARLLKIHWQLHEPRSISSEPIVANGVVYWGSWDGYEHATNLNGQQLWQTYLGVSTPPATLKCTPASAGVAGAATVTTVPINGTMTPVVFVDGGNVRFYALNATNGSIIWSTPLGVLPDYMIWAGASVFNGSVYVGLSSYGDCPLIPGAVFQLNASTGAVQHSFTFVASGCKGAGVWMVPTIDATTGIVYVSTGTIAPCSTYEKMAYALVALHAADLSYVGSWQVPSSQYGKDSDFGSTPTLFTATINGAVHQMIGLINKNGIYYAFDRSNVSAGPLWETRISTSPNNIASSAWNGSTLYVAGTTTTINGKPCFGSIDALNPATGVPTWEYCAPGKIDSALMITPGLVFAGVGGHFVVLNAATGQQLFIYKDPARNATFWCGSTVSNGVVYTADEAGNLYAFGL